MAKYCVLFAAGADNANANFNNIIFTIKDTKLYLPVVTLSARENQKLSKLSKGFERSHFVEVSRLVLVYSNQDDNSRIFKAKRCYLLIGIIKNYVIINGQNVHDWAVDSNVKQYEEIIKVTTGQGEDYTTGYLLDCDYFKNHHKLTEVNLSRKKKLDVDPKAIQEIELVEQLKNADDVNADGTQSILISTILENIKETR